MKLRWLLILLTVCTPFLLIDCTYSSASSAAYNELGARAAAGEMPDVVFMDGLRIAEFVQQGLLQPLPRERFALEDIPESLLAHFEFEGELYAIPRDYQPLALLVNGELLAAQGFEVPADWESLLAVGTALTFAEREAGNEAFSAIGLTTGFYNYLPFFFQAGGQLYGPGQETLQLESEAGLASLQYYADLVNQEAATVIGGEWPEVGGYTTLLNRFVEGSIAMAVVNPRMYDLVRADLGEQFSAERARLVALPAGPAGQATVANVRAFALAGEPTEANLAVLEHLTSAEVLRRWVGDQETPVDYIPARLSLQDAWREVHPEVAAFSDSVSFVRPYTPPPVSPGAMAEFDRLAQEQLIAVLQQGLAPEAALSALQASGNRLLGE